MGKFWTWFQYWFELSALYFVLCTGVIFGVFFLWMMWPDLLVVIVLFSFFLGAVGVLRKMEKSDRRD
jgi:hypothetical protein